jgi:hypothetical protein
MGRKGGTLANLGGLVSGLGAGNLTSIGFDFLQNPPRDSGLLQVMVTWLLLCTSFAIVVWVIWALVERSPEKNWRNIFKGVGLGTLVGTAVGLGGFFLAETPRSGGMGAVMFLLVPFCAGFAIAMVTRGRNTAWASALLAVLGSLAFLVAGKLEGLLCAILAFPLLVLGLGIGAVFGYLFRRHVVERHRQQITGVTNRFRPDPSAYSRGPSGGNACA